MSKLSDGDRKTVVIVEDDEDMREVIDRMFRRHHGFEITGQAADARRAVDAIRSSRPDLVVLDHYIGGRVMGLESASVFKTVSPETKLIVFTETDLGLEACLEPEVDGYLRKRELDQLVGLACRLVGISSVGYPDGQTPTDSPL